MNRIKFRAWDKFYNEFDTYHINKIVISEIDKKSERFIFMQFTGMKDSEGKEIYEGDILQFDIIKDHLYKVNYINGCFWLNRINSLEQFPMYDANLNRQKIIGNIYENPDLIS